MTQTLFEALQGFNSEVITVGTILSDFPDGGNPSDDDDADLFQCGKCKKQFHSLGTFMLHKKSHQLDGFTLSQKSLPESLTNDASNETDLQLQPIILSESDILAFSIGQAGLNLTTDDQSLNEFEGSEALMLIGNEESNLKEPKDTTSSFELRSTQLILTTQVTDEEPIEALLLTTESSENNITYTLDQPINFLDTNSLIITTNNIELEDCRNELSMVEKENATELEKETKLKCYYCFKPFTKESNLQQHLRCHTGERPYQCVVCGRSFRQKSHVTKHMATHKVWPHKLRTLPEKPLKKITTLASGETVVVDGSFACQYCSATFSNVAQLKTHRKTHANSKIFKCVQKDCQAVFETMDLFLEHTAMHQSDSNTRYTCSHCRQQFTNLDELGNHQRVHGPCTKKKLSAVTCKLCKAKFSTGEALERHQTEDPHSYPCPECNKVYVCERHLRRHLQTHSTVPTHPCLECGKIFKNAQNLSLHKLVHSSEKPFSCNLCEAAFARKDRLARHILIHDTNRRFKCPFNKHLGCKKEFYRKDKLKQHLLIHSLSKSLKCMRCSRVFKRSSQLKQHEVVCLSEDKPCKDCGHVTTSLDHYKKNTGKAKENISSNRRKHRLLEGSQTVDDGVPTIQVVVVPLNNSKSELPERSEVSSLKEKMDQLDEKLDDRSDGLEQYTRKQCVDIL